MTIHPGIDAKKQDQEQQPHFHSLVNCFLEEESFSFSCHLRVQNQWFYVKFLRIIQWFFNWVFAVLGCRYLYTVDDNSYEYEFRSTEQHILAREYTGDCEKMGKCRTANRTTITMIENNEQNDWHCSKVNLGDRHTSIFYFISSWQTTKWRQPHVLDTWLVPRLLQALTKNHSNNSKCMVTGDTFTQTHTNSLVFVNFESLLLC
jgi:hypothetical protein